MLQIFLLFLKEPTGLTY